MTHPPSRTTNPSNGGGGGGGGGSRRGLTLPPLPPLPHSSFLENTTNIATNRHRSNNNDIIYAMSILDAALAIVDEEPGMS